MTVNDRQPSEKCPSTKAGKALSSPKLDVRKSKSHSVKPGTHLFLFHSDEDVVEQWPYWMVTMPTSTNNLSWGRYMQRRSEQVGCERAHKECDWRIWNMMVGGRKVNCVAVPVTHTDPRRGLSFFEPHSSFLVYAFYSDFHWYYSRTRINYLNLTVA